MKKGFTLVELMVVIVIIGILAALVIALLLSRVEKAKYSEGMMALQNRVESLELVVSRQTMEPTTLRHLTFGGQVESKKLSVD